MKLFAFINKLIFVVNILFAMALLLSCIVPYISLETAPFVAFFSLCIPILVLSNLLFVIFWGFRRKKQLFVSMIVLVISYFSLSSFFMFRLSSGQNTEADLKVMTFNVRGFNKYKNIDSPNIFSEILELIDSESPDVIAFQEFDDNQQMKFKNYKYKYLKYIDNKGKVTLAVYSKYPIINEGLINFPESPNNAAFVDVVVKNDTVRVYNLHLESLRVIPNKDVIAKEESKKLYKRLSHTFKKQQEQAAIVREHINNTKFKTIVCGDFNGTQYSNVYKTIRGNLQDTFQEAGSGYGRTYNFKYYPVRIDFILVDPTIEVLSHKNYNAKLSDHFPVMTSINF